MVSFRGSVILLSFFLFIGSTRVLIASSNDADAATSNKSRFNLSAPEGGIIDLEELSIEYPHFTTFNLGDAVITADYTKCYLKKSADGGLPLNEGSTENIEDYFERIVTHGNVKIVYEATVATGDEAVYDLEMGSFVLTGDLAKLIRSADTMTSAEITAKKIVFNNAQLSSEFIGNVTVTQGETVITADNVEAFFKKGVDGRLSLNMESTETILESFEKIIASDNVKIVSEDIVATGDKAVYDSVVDSFVLTGDPAKLVGSMDTMTSAEITAEKIVLNSAELSSEFVGNVTVTQGETVITADNVKAFFKKGADGRLSLNMESTETILESFGKIIADGNVKIVSEDIVATGDEAVYDSAVDSFVLTGDPAKLIGSADTMTSAEITAENSEITAEKIVFNIAELSSEFIGDVTVTQGETVITADNVKTYFSKNADGRLSLNMESTENIVEWFEKITAGGNVKIVSEDIVATGDEAVYDSAVESLVLTGDPATLEKGALTLTAPVVETLGKL